MAIKSNRKIDFEYEFESPSGSYSILLRFYHTEEYGPTIGVLGDDGESAINFPVTMFSEVAEYLTDQGILEGKRTLPTPQVPYKLPKTSTASTASTKPSLALPKPKFLSGRPSLVNPLKVGGNTVRDVVEVNLEDDNGEDLLDAPDDMREALRKEKERLDGIHAAVSGSTPAQSLSNSAEQINLSEEEINQMIKERNNAKNKSRVESKSIRRKDE